MICLKNRTFAVSQTTNIGAGKLYIRLWFAWKIVLLQYRKQPAAPSIHFCLRCDLLEKSYFCSIANNIDAWRGQQGAVVICLKNRTFAVSQTTYLFDYSILYMLWFAWKIVLLQYRKQPIGFSSSCVLVVICLKNRTFAVSQTTALRQLPHTGGLWFAWKIVLLQYRKQHLRGFQPPHFRLWFAWKIVLLQYRKQLPITGFLEPRCCDLLEKSYFCSIANNIR